MDNQITDAVLVANWLVQQIGAKELCIVATMDVDTGELLSLDYQNCFPDSHRTINMSPRSKNKLERFFDRLNREFLCQCGAQSLAAFYHDADNYIDTLRDAEGRVFL